MRTIDEVIDGVIPIVVVKMSYLFTFGERSKKSQRDKTMNEKAFPSSITEQLHGVVWNATVVDFKGKDTPRMVAVEYLSSSTAAGIRYANATNTTKRRDLI